MSGMSLIPANYGNRSVGALNQAGVVAVAPWDALADVVVYVIRQLFQRKKLMSATPSTITDLQGSAGNTITVPFLDPTTNKNYKVETTITLVADNNDKKQLAIKVQDGPAALTEVHEAQAAALTEVQESPVAALTDVHEAQAAALTEVQESPAEFEKNKQFFLNELEGAKVQLKKTSIAGVNYVPPNVTDDIFELLESKVGAGGDVDKLFAQLQELVISSYIADNYGSLSQDEKKKLMENATRKSSEFYYSEMKKSGTSDLEKSENDEIFRKFFNILRTLLTNDKNMFENTDETKFRKDDPTGDAIKVAVINLNYTVTGIIKTVAEQLGYSEAAPDYLGGGSRQNKGMFNYAHFIPLRNRSKKHNYATKIKPNSRHRRRNKTSNKRRSRRS